MGRSLGLRSRWEEMKLELRWACGWKEAQGQREANRKEGAGED